MVPVPMLRTHTEAVSPTSEVMLGGSRVGQVKPRKWRQRKCTPAAWTLRDWRLAVV